MFALPMRGTMMWLRRVARRRQRRLSQVLAWAMSDEYAPVVD
jgi:hypothetical protein